MKACPDTDRRGDAGIALFGIAEDAAGRQQRR